MKLNYMENPYSFWETERLQDELIELDRHLDDVQQDPELSRIAQTHKFLAEVALFERIL
jgi:hypothetical protein